MKTKLVLLLLLALLPTLAQAEIINIDNFQLKELMAQQVPLVDIVPLRNGPKPGLSLAVIC